MINARSIVFQRLLADGTLTALLGGYGSAPSVPAIFTAPVPHNLVTGIDPHIIVDFPIGDDDDDTYTEEYREVDLRVRLYSKPHPSVGGTQKLDDAAVAARKALKSWPRSNVTGGVFISATVTGPVDAPTTDPTNAGRLLNVRLNLQEV
jgi:hypothetical protein